MLKTHISLNEELFSRELVLLEVNSISKISIYQVARAIVLHQVGLHKWWQRGQQMTSDTSVPLCSFADIIFYRNQEVNLTGVCHLSFVTALRTVSWLDLYFSNIVIIYFDFCHPQSPILGLLLYHSYHNKICVHHGIMNISACISWW